MNYDDELEKCLVVIARKYAPDLLDSNWQRPGDLNQPPHEFARTLLRHDVLVIIGDRAGHPDDESVQAAAKRCHRHYRALYSLLIDHLFSYTLADISLKASYCEASDFVVLSLYAPAGPLIPALGNIVTPFVIQHHVPQQATASDLQELTDDLLEFLDADDEALAEHPRLRDQIAGAVETLCQMDLRPLPLLIPELDLPEVGAEDEQITEPYQANDDALDDDDEDNGGNNGRRPLQGPIPRFRD